MYNTLMKDTRNEIRNLIQIPKGQEVPLRAADIALFCEDGDFQRIIFKAPLRPAHQDPEVFQLVKKLWGNQANRPTEEQLKAACGRSGDLEYMVIDVQRVEERWRQAERAGKDGTTRPDPAANGQLSGGAPPEMDDAMASLLDDSPLNEFAPKTTTAADPFASATPSAPASAAPVDPFAASATAPAPASPAPVPEAPADPWAADAPAPAAPVPAAAPAGVASFDDLIDS
jgi:hypothetical protein